MPRSSSSILVCWHVFVFACARCPPCTQPLRRRFDAAAVESGPARRRPPSLTEPRAFSSHAAAPQTCATPAMRASTQPHKCTTPPCCCCLDATRTDPSLCCRRNHFLHLLCQTGPGQSALSRQLVISRRRCLETILPRITREGLVIPSGASRRPRFQRLGRTGTLQAIPVRYAHELFS